ncbi:hypothetical protein QUF80_23415, partial [Desulfococcaceae bacterium HSG8]|nr:hypothetical protein [Desulfococcaceae bacterium HSG8]
NFSNPRENVYDSLENVPADGDLYKLDPVPIEYATYVDISGFNAETGAGHQIYGDEGINVNGWQILPTEEGVSIKQSNEGIRVGEKRRQYSNGHKLVAFQSRNERTFVSIIDANNFYAENEERRTISDNTKFNGSQTITSVVAKNRTINGVRALKEGESEVLYFPRAKVRKQADDGSFYNTASEIYISTAGADKNKNAVQVIEKIAKTGSIR